MLAMQSVDMIQLALLQWLVISESVRCLLADVFSFANSPVIFMMLSLLL